MNTIIVVALLLGIASINAFSTQFRVGGLKHVAATRAVKSNGARSMTAFMDVLAGLSLAAQLHSAPLNPSPAAFATQSMMLAKEELRSGMYKEYTVDVPEQSNTLDDVRKGYKTAAETDEGKTKYWAIFAVLVAGSFIIPMAQYYWYVAEEAD